MGKNEYIPWDPFADMEEFSPQFKSDKAVQLKGVGPVRNYILYVGDIDRERDLESFCKFDNKYNPILIVSSGDEEYKKELEEKFPHVNFAGELYGEELAKAYANAKVFVNPNPDRSAGFTSLEAIASGVPVATLKSDFSDIHIKKGKNGYYDENDILLAISECLKDKNIDPRGYTDETCEDPCHRYSLHYSSLTFFASLNSRYLCQKQL